ncbi:hypothetical protein JCM10450v2_002045 [Rhodotorula kratochvilovae]
MQKHAEPDADRQDLLDEWTSALEGTDAFVARLIDDQRALARQIEEAAWAPPRQPDPQAEQRAQEQQRVIDALREEIEQYHTINAELEYSAQDLARKIEERSAAVARAKAAAPPRPATSEAVQGRREPVILVLIDGSSAPFSEKFVSRGWEGGAEAEHNIDIDELGDPNAPQPAVLCFLWHNRKALVFNFKDTKVLSNDGQWDSLLAGFVSVANNHAMDIGDASACASISQVITTVGRSPATKRIYLAGINLEELYGALPDLRPNKASILHVDIVPKLVLIDHRESDDTRETLLTPPSPIIGPGDQNHDPGADEYGHEDVYDSRNFAAGGGWSRVGRRGRSARV